MWVWSSAGMKERGKREIPEKTRQPPVSSGTILTCENPGVTRSVIEHGSHRLEAGRLTALPPRHPDKSNVLQCLQLVRPTDACRELRNLPSANSDPLTFHLLSPSQATLYPGGKKQGACTRVRTGAKCVRGLDPIRLQGRESMQRGMHRGGWSKVSKEQRRNVKVGKREIPEKTHRPAARFPLVKIHERYHRESNPVSPPGGKRSPPGSPDFRKWGSCRTISLVGGLSRGSPVYPALSFQCLSILTSITLIGSQDLAVKSRPNLFTQSSLFQ
ncbi:hypothetical protein PR048_017683 [Dryococelus australis]|uniref:Uncharacterized protein n=1 Tax=Dryococelus australis TaxID=614101 RepID=A0ABQ9HAB0_9NEOP|nr:hypothetical protein PR048_017683 [Dryococelus australis]